MKGEVEEEAEYMGRLAPFRFEEFTTDEKVELKGDAATVVAGGPECSAGDATRSVDKGARPRRVPETGGGKPQTECCALPACAPEF